MNKIKHVIVLLVLILFTFTLFKGYVNAREEVIEENMESIIMLDVARRYFTVDEIKKYIDVLAQNENSTLQLHLTDDENVGIECTYLNQTKANATVVDNAYINPVTGKKFLTYDQVRELMDYAKTKKVTLVPEIEMPAHMYGFFELAMNKFGNDFVKHAYDWDNPVNSGIAWKNDGEKGNIDLLAPNAKPFIFTLLDEYTNFFSDCKYFHVGYDEYTLRQGDDKINFINELYTYLNNKGYTMRMWSDVITKDNIDSINNNIQITYWGWKEADILTTNYATVKDLQAKGFKVLISNKYYLFFVPAADSVDQTSLDFTVNSITNDWTLEKWNYNYTSDLDNLDNILGGMVCTWTEHSNGVSDNTILNQTTNMYNAMFSKLPKIQKTITIDDNNTTENTTNNTVNNTVENNTTNNNVVESNNITIDNKDNQNNEVINNINENTNNVTTGDNIITYISIFILSTLGLLTINYHLKHR